MVSRRWAFSVLALAMLGVVTFGAVKLATANTGRADCPGKIVCPETGELICRDQCSMIDQNRPDCPGQIVCPKTGELVCKDRCPVGDAALMNADTKVERSCCRTGK